MNENSSYTGIWKEESNFEGPIAIKELLNVVDTREKNMNRCPLTEKAAEIAHNLSIGAWFAMAVSVFYFPPFHYLNVVSFILNYRKDLVNELQMFVRICLQQDLCVVGNGI